MLNKARFSFRPTRAAEPTYPALARSLTPSVLFSPNSITFLGSKLRTNEQLVSASPNYSMPSKHNYGVKSEPHLKERIEKGIVRLHLSPL